MTGLGWGGGACFPQAGVIVYLENEKHSEISKSRPMRLCEMFLFIDKGARIEDGGEVVA